MKYFNFKIAILFLSFLSFSQLHAGNFMVEAGYFGNGDFSETGFGGFNLDGRIFFSKKAEGIFVNLNPILFAAGSDYALENNLPTSFTSFQFGGGFQTYLSKVLYFGFSAGAGYGNGEFKTQDSVFGIRFSSAETRSALVTTYGAYLGLTAPPRGRFGFSGKVGIKGITIDSEPALGVEISAGFRIGR